MNSSQVSRNSKAARALQEARALLRERSFAAGFSQLQAVDQQSPVGPSDLMELAQAAILMGKESEGCDLLARAHREYISEGEVCAAARCAFWLGFMALLNREMAQANGWLARAERILADQPDCVERGYLLVPVGYRGVHGGDSAEAVRAFAQAADIGNRFGDKDLVTLALQGQGRALIRSGEVARGVTLLDEAMVAVTAGEVTPLVAGGVYCSVIEGCSEIFDIRRAQEWTSALQQWCASQPDIVAYRGHCRLRRAEILELHGSWEEALEEARSAGESLVGSAGNAAMYRMAELYRLRGQFKEAEEAYRQSGAWEHSLPGCAQLRFAQGQLDAAVAAIRRIASEIHEPARRARILDVYVTIALASGDVGAARAAAEELAGIAERFGVPLIRAVSLRAAGSVLLAQNSLPPALDSLRQAWNLWSEIDAPYEAALTRVLIAQACRELGDEDAAISELGAARDVFERLGAIPDLRRIEVLLSPKSPRAGPLSAREVEVLRLVASGMTNREIADKLRISEKTVARHLSNIFVKLDLPSRAAATAYAFKHNLV